MANEPGRNAQVGLSIQEALRRVQAALETIRYGEVTVKVENGKPIWVDKFERERVALP